MVVDSAIRAIHVDEMNPPCSRARELGERLERIGERTPGARHAPAFDVNGGIELHGL